MKELLHKMRSDFEEFLKTKIHHKPPETLYSPINYIMANGGKRIRALLTLLGFYGYRDDYPEAMNLAYAIELFHNFTLMHDDIMDAAPLRRGKPSVHENFDTNAAILSGDVMTFYVIKELAQSDPSQVNYIITRFCDEAITVCEGQAMDMDFETRDEVSIAEYLEMIEAKTSVLIGLALEIGALHAGASPDSAHHLFQFGKYAGIAFQLQDDYLDLYGDANKVGKQIGGDIIQRKRNFFYVKALELLEGKERKAFMVRYNTRIDNNDRVNHVKNIYDEFYLKNYLDESKKNFLDLANSHLEMSEYDVGKVEILENLARKLAFRVS